MKTLSQTKAWFIRKGIYDIFCEQIGAHDFSSFEDVFRHGPQMINAGLTWSHTNEGPEFWRERHEELMEFWNSKEKVKTYKPLFKVKDSLRIKKNLENEIIDINDDMLELCGKKATITAIEDNEYAPKSTTQDAAYYYIKEDKGINAWTCEMFKKE